MCSGELWISFGRESGRCIWYIEPNNDTYGLLSSVSATTLALHSVPPCGLAANQRYFIVHRGKCDGSLNSIVNKIRARCRVND
jgi:hypothetical protein